MAFIITWSAQTLRYLGWHQAQTRMPTHKVLFHISVYETASNHGINLPVSYCYLLFAESLSSGLSIACRKQRHHVHSIPNIIFIIHPTQ